MNRSTHILTLTLTLSALLVQQLRADDDLHAFGEWNIYNATPECTQMQVFADQLFVVNTSSLTSIDLDLDPDSQQGYSRTTGLSGASVQFIQASRQAQRLAITYDDGNIDLMDTEGNILCIPDLASKPLSGDKSIYSLRESEGKLYVSGGFGVLVIDMELGMIVNHYPTSYPIQFAFSHEDVMYRYSDHHHLEYLLPGDNGNDPASWHTFPGNTALRDATSFTNREGQHFCYAITSNGELMKLTRDGLVSTAQNQAYTHLYRLNNLLLAQGKVLTFCDPAAETYTHNGYSPYKDCTDFVAVDDSSCYMLQSYYGIFRAQFSNYIPNQNLNLDGDYNHGALPNGVATAYLGQMHLTEHGIVGISRRSYVMGLSAANALSGVITYVDTDEGEIRNVLAREVMTRLPEKDYFQALQGFDIDPTQPDRYAICSGLYGLYILEGDSVVECYDGLNSVGKVDAFDPSFRSTRVSSVAYDDDGNLFFANSMQDTILRCLTTDGRWLKYPNRGFSQLQDARKILISRHGNNNLKWLLNDAFYRRSCVGIYDDGGTLAVQSDDRTASFSTLVDQDYNEWELDYIYDLCEDLNGKIWVLTNLGPFVIEDPVATFNYATANPGKGKVRRVKIPRNDGTNLADYLMEATSCSCMLVDNFNRKWIGTYGAGLYLMSGDCITEIQHFDTDNSPLISNSILDLAYDASTGLLYVSCEGGLLTYQTDAIEGADDFSGIHCYPNPVRPEFSGELRIMGLMNDSQVSITTVGGNLVYRTRSQGNTATWDLFTAQGQRAEPGVYLIHGVDREGKTGKICRFLVL